MGFNSSSTHKEQRLNQQKQMREQKREELKLRKRLSTAFCTLYFADFAV